MFEITASAFLSQVPAPLLAQGGQNDFFTTLMQILLLVVFFPAIAIWLPNLLR